MWLQLNSVEQRIQFEGLPSCQLYSQSIEDCLVINEPLGDKNLTAI